ncbi:deoxyribose-phosphate aldolase [Mangrovicoccus ximenensis]|uniref:deoxyribose-phosphate aldolase n=1 Tax=Mangrovicoccus ximenensis TaxID=1911570 RepID=UPI001EFF6CBE|nr:deoxyribose-phosphate aldolase [Mangrovicoccus ximenensis]
MAQTREDSPWRPGLDRIWTFLPLPQELLDLALPGAFPDRLKRSGPLWSALAPPPPREPRFARRPRPRYMPVVGRVRRLCAKARQPVRADLLEALGLPAITTGAVCVYHEMIAPAVEALKGSGIPVAAVSTGFPAGLSPFDLRLKEIEASVAAGAEEIDIVISRRHVLTGNWQALYDETRAMRAACGAAHMKAILATGELGTLQNVARASLVCMMAGSDFIKTSTGKESVNATLPVSLVMVRAIRAYREATGIKVGYKPAGGISKAKDALTYMALMKEELGDDWLRPDLFRFGASSLLGDIERQLEHHVTGAYSASWRHALG